jgi:hypothetical protein
LAPGVALLDNEVARGTDGGTTFVSRITLTEKTSCFETH